MSATRIVHLQKVYRHYKGGRYVPVLEATETESEEILVVYIDLSNGRYFARLKTMFLEDVETETGTVPRFTLEKAELPDEHIAKPR